MSTFESTVLTSRNGNEFHRWSLGTFASARGGETEISAATGLGCESVRAAAWNLQNNRGFRTENFLRNVVRNGVQAGSVPGGVRYHVPGAQVHVHGFDEPVAINLEAVVDSAKDGDLALGIMVSALCQVVARGVYAQEPKEQPTESEDAESEDDTKELESIQF